MEIFRKDMVYGNKGENVISIVAETGSEDIFNFFVANKHNDITIKVEDNRKTLRGITLSFDQLEKIYLAAKELQP